MAKNKKDESKKTAKQLAEEREKLDILARAGNVKGEQLFVNNAGSTEWENEMRKFDLSGIEDPEKKFEVYYRGIQKLLLTHLPKGKQNQTARSFIHEEKKTYLTRGKRIKKDGTRGADSRMGYNTDHDEMLKIIMDWIMENGTMVDLYNSLRDLNKSKGYGIRQF